MKSWIPAILVPVACAGLACGPGEQGATGGQAEAPAPAKPACPTASAIAGHGEGYESFPQTIDAGRMAATAAKRVDGKLEVAMATVPANDLFQSYWEPAGKSGDMVMILTFIDENGEPGAGSYEAPDAKPKRRMEIKVGQIEKDGKSSRTTIYPRKGTAEIIEVNDQRVCGTFSMSGPVNSIEGQFVAPFTKS